MPPPSTGGVPTNPVAYPEWYPGETPEDLCGAFRSALLRQIDEPECGCPARGATGECGEFLDRILTECNPMVRCRSDCAYCPSTSPCGAETCGCEEGCMKEASDECVTLYYDWERCVLGACQCCMRVGARCMTDVQCCFGRCAGGVCERE
jgi:hypothetical protein